jgi:hemerythrin superfamily protein
VSVILRGLKIHTQIEEEIYYPRVREKADIDDRVSMAEEEHMHAKELIKEIEAASTADDGFDAKIKELDDVIRLHISEERDALFDAAEVMGVNTPELARELFARKQELAAEIR